MVKTKPQVAIVGFGRFGQTLYRLIKDDFIINIYDAKKINRHDLAKDTQVLTKVADVYNSPTIFYCVPIPKFESVIKAHKKYFKDHLLIDVLSVKMHPAKVFKKYLKGTKAHALLTHPMFGPDSSQNGFAGLPIMIDKFTASSKAYAKWKKYFKNKKLRVVELSAEEHDRLAAYSQGIAHFVGRLLDEIGMKPTPIDTMGTRKLNEMREQIGHNTWELFVGLQNYNPHAKEMRRRFGQAYQKLCKKLR
ncbi:MAG: prephenate dehydrogenase/arogenate dehydrogenase family protein [Candidatus Paceibacterota bacterium]|jgi:prephenate dehydrogenase